jgi:predicted GIY-YIG superfamily endonuclease
MEKSELSKKATIYKISCDDYSYIGSTRQNIKRRYQMHKHNYKQYIKGRHNRCRLFDIFMCYDVDNTWIEALEELEDVDKKKIKERELYYIMNTKNSVNHNMPKV